MPAATTTAPAPSQVTVQGLPTSNVPVSTSKAARPNDFWQQPFAGGGAGGSAGRGGNGGWRGGARTSMPSAAPLGVGGGGGGDRGGAGGGASGGGEMVKALFQYVAQVRYRSNGNVGGGAGKGYTVSRVATAGRAAASRCVVPSFRVLAAVTFSECHVYARV